MLRELYITKELVARKCYKDLELLPISTNWKGTSYNSILVIVDLLTPVTTQTGLHIFIG